jgi:hypothetical protein
MHMVRSLDLGKHRNMGAHDGQHLAPVSSNERLSGIVRGLFTVVHPSGQKKPGE